jgi:hypothetical protein
MRIAIAALCVLTGPGAGAAGERSGGLRLAQREGARLTVAATIHATPSSEVAVPIQVGPAHTLPPKSFLRLRGLPPAVSLNLGYSIAPGSWAIPLAAVASLKANVPPWVSGRYQIGIALIGGDGEQLAEASVLFVISREAPSPAPPGRAAPQQGPAKAGPPPAPVAPPTPTGPQQDAAKAVPPPPPVTAPEFSSAPKPPPPELSPEEKDQLQKLIAQGERYIAQGERYLLEGNIGVARQFYKRAADAGYPPGAMRLAETYDPVELAASSAQGIAPNVAEARRWYELARDLGAPDAEARLARLSRN